MSGPARDAGVYHVVTHTWTRKAPSAGIGADIVYNNTCSTGTFNPLLGDRFVDEGRVPSTTSPTNANSRPGCANQYTIDGFQIGYCTDDIGFRSSLTQINFYPSYSACATVVGALPVAGVALTGLPGSTTGSSNCWIVTIDLDSPPQSTSLAFTMLADGDGAYTGASNLNLFGWSFENNLPDANQLGTGPIVAGDFNVCTGYDGTRWDSPINYAEPGTGMGTLDMFRVEDGPSTPGCYYLGGNPLASYHLELYGDACLATCPTPTLFCFGDGTGTTCPCANNSPVGANVGCLNSLGTGGKLRTTGSNSITGDTLVLVGTQMPNNWCLYFQGTLQQSGGGGTAFGDGKRCAGGTVIKLGPQRWNFGGASSYPVGSDLPIHIRGNVTIPGTVRTYQAWYRNSVPFCTGDTFNLTNGIEVVWCE